MIFIHFLTENPSLSIFTLLMKNSVRYLLKEDVMYAEQTNHSERCDRELGQVSLEKKEEGLSQQRLHISSHLLKLRSEEKQVLSPQISNKTIWMWV